MVRLAELVRTRGLLTEREAATIRRAPGIAATGSPRLELERALRVVGREEHTETGAHRVALVPFEAWLPDAVRRASERLSLDDALAALRAAGWEPPAARPAGPARARRRRGA